MLIESRIKPTARPTRKVAVFGITYEFTSVAGGRYVAKVEDEAAIACFLANPAYSEFTDKLDTGPSLSRGEAKGAPPAPEKPAAPVKPPVKVDPPAPPAPDASATATADTAAAQALLASTPLAIKKQLEKNLPSRAVLTAALALEQAQTKPRVHVVSNLSGVLSSLDA